MSERTDVIKHVKENIALTASAALVVVSTIRVYYFAGFRPDVALSVLSVANRTQVLVSTVLSIVVFIAPLALFVQPLRRWLFAGNVTGAPFILKLRTGVIWLPLAPLILSTMSVLFLTGTALGFAILWGAGRRERKKLAGNPVAEAKLTGWRDLHQWLVATVAGFALMMTLSTPWQPMERIALQTESKSMVGYVIGEQAGKTLIVDKARQALWTKNDDIASRELCDRGVSWWTASPAGIVDIATSQPQADCK